MKPFSIYVSFLRYFILNRIAPQKIVRFYCKVRLFQTEKISRLTMELAEAQTRQVSVRFILGDKLISEYFENTF